MKYVYVKASDLMYIDNIKSEAFMRDRKMSTQNVQ